MGEVYRARDTRLNRDVAIKVLLPAVANDPDRLARFSREAQVLASLNHPNIAQIYGVEEANGVTALVMELVEGEDLSQRIARGPVPLDEALPIARQIAEALEAAHDHGIIHRDLKPANIKVRPDGTVKVLDFGLAKAVDPTAGSSAAAMNSPTLSLHATEAGIILGTAAYMSPEQAAGKIVDKRSDLWAFGAVLFEMLTGRQVFRGETVSHLIAAVLKDEPDWSALPSDTPAPIRRLLRRCLQKDKKQRVPDAADARLEIDEALSTPHIDATLFPESATASGGRRWLAFGAFVVGGLLLGTASWALPSAWLAPIPAAPVRFALHDDDAVIVSRVGGEVAISPDGRWLAFVGFDDKGARIWLRALDALDARPLPGTEGAGVLNWSPDGQSLAFTALGRIKTIPVTGGPAQVIATAVPTDLTWRTDGTIVWTGIRTVRRIQASGGELANILPADTGETYGSVMSLPDTRHILIAISSDDAAKAGTFAVAVDGGPRKRILPFPTTARYAMGHLLFVRDRVLFAQPFDLSRLEFGGEPRPLADSVATVFSVSEFGAVVYLPLSAEQGRSTQLAWMDRSGRVLSRIDQAAGATRPILSPDDRRLAMMLGADIWVLELQRGVLSRVTTGGRVADATWLPNSQQIMFRRSAAKNGKDLIVTIVTGSADKETVVLEPADGANSHAHVNDVSRDGRYFAFDNFDGGDLAVRALAGDATVTLHGEGAGVQTQGVFSPDTKRLAYASDSSSRFEIYVDGVPEPGTRIQLSTKGGSSPRWRSDGKELFYTEPDGTLMAVPVQSIEPLEFGAPVALFRFVSPNRGNAGGKPAYDVAADGQRFIVSAIVRSSDSSLNVLLNWPALMTTKGRE